MSSLYLLPCRATLAAHVVRWWRPQCAVWFIVAFFVTFICKVCVDYAVQCSPAIASPHDGISSMASKAAVPQRIIIPIINAPTPVAIGMHQPHTTRKKEVPLKEEQWKVRKNSGLKKSQRAPKHWGAQYDPVTEISQAIAAIESAKGSDVGELIQRCVQNISDAKMFIGPIPRARWVIIEGHLGELCAVIASQLDSCTLQDLSGILDAFAVLTEQRLIQTFFHGPGAPLMGMIAARLGTLAAANPLSPRQAARAIWATTKVGLRRDWLTAELGKDLLNSAALEQLSAQDQAQLAWALSKGLSPWDRALLQSIAVHVATADVLHEYEGPSISKLLYACAKSGFVHMPLIDALVHRMKQPGLLATFQPLDISLTVWALATFNVGHYDVLEWLARRITQRDILPLLNPQMISNILWGFAKLGVYNEAVMRELARRALHPECFHHFGPRAMANTIWAYAKLGHPDHQLITRMIHRAWDGDLLRYFEPSGLAALGWTCAKLQMAPDGFLEALTQEVLGRLTDDPSNQQEWGPRELSNMVWAFASLGHCDQQFFYEATCLLRRPSLVSGLSAHQCSNLVWAYAKCNVHDPLLISRLSDRIHAILPSYGPLAASNTAWAFAKLQVPRNPMLDALARHTADPVILSGMTVQGLINAVWAYATLGMHPTVLTEGIARQVLEDKMLSTMDSRQLSTLLWAYAKMGDMALNDALLSRMAQPGVVDDFNAQDVVVSLWALARQRISPAPVIAALTSKLAEAGFLSTFKAAELSSLAWSFATLHLRHQTLLTAIAKQFITSISQSTAQYLANMAWAYATLDMMLPELAMAISQQLRSNDILTSLTGQECSNTLWALGTSNTRDEALIAALMARSVESSTLNTLSAPQISDILWTLGKTGFRDPTALDLLTGHILQTGLLVMFTAQHVAETSWALARLEFLNPELMNAIARKVLQMQPEVDDLGDYAPEYLSHVAWSFSALGVFNTEVFHAIAESALRPAVLPHFTAPSISNLLWAFAAANVRHEALLEAFSTHALQTPALEDLSPASAAAIAWAFAKLTWRNVPVMERLAAVLQRPGSLSTLNPSEVASTAWAFATLDIPAHGLLASIAEQLPPVVATLDIMDISHLTWAFATFNMKEEALMMELATRAMQVMPKDPPSAQNLVNIAWAYATLQIPHVDLSTAVVNQATQPAMLSTFDASQTVTLAWALATLQIPVPCRSVVEGLGDHLLTNGLVDNLEPPQLSTLLWSLASCEVHIAPLTSAIINRLLQPHTLQSFTSSQLIITAWAFATLDVFDIDLLVALATHMTSFNIAAWSPAEVAKVAWAYGKFKMLHTPLMSAIKASVMQGVLQKSSAKDALDLVWALAALGMEEEQLAVIVAEWGATPMALAQMGPADLSRLAWALAAMDCRNDAAAAALLTQLSTLPEHDVDLASVFPLVLHVNIHQSQMPNSATALGNLAPRFQGGFVAPRLSVADQLQTEVANTMKALGVPYVENVILQEAGGHHATFVLRTGKLVVEPCGDDCYVHLGHGHVDSGAVKLRRRQLQAFGWQLITVPSYIWDSFAGVAEKQAYLQQKLTMLRSFPVK